MFNEGKLKDMVIDLKLGESSESFEEMLEKVSQDNRLYGELVKTSKKETIDKTMELMKEYDFIYGTVGVHPEECAPLQESDMELLQEIKEIATVK